MRAVCSAILCWMTYLFCPLPKSLGQRRTWRVTVHDFAQHFFCPRSGARILEASSCQCWWSQCERNGASQRWCYLTSTVLVVVNSFGQLSV